MNYLLFLDNFLVRETRTRLDFAATTLIHFKDYVYGECMNVVLNGNVTI